MLSSSDSLLVTVLIIYFFLFIISVDSDIPRAWPDDFAHDSTIGRSFPIHPGMTEKIALFRIASPPYLSFCTTSNITK